MLTIETDANICPKCAGKPELISFYIKGVPNRIHHVVRCSDCKYRADRNSCRKRGKAIIAWNKLTSVQKEENHG